MKLLKVIFLICSITFVSQCSAQTVYITKTGKKYHKEHCRYLKHSKIEITLEKAIELNYGPCSVCKPETKISANKKSKPVSNTKSLTTNNTTKKAVATQCTGKTKSGARCKRMTKNANGRCYQHQ